MSERRQDKYLSQKERIRFDALAESTTVKQAAAKLGLSESTMNNWSSKLRKRLIRERGHLNACLAQRQRGKLIKKVLSTRKPLKPADEEEYEGEEMGT